MRFKQFLLNEGSYYEDISIEKAIELAKKHCSNALKHLETPIIRGGHNFTDVAYSVHPGLGSRKSANTSNHYTVLFNETLPKEYPRRANSMICGNYQNKDYARGFGQLYVILPYDDVMFGVCADEDLWRTRIKIADKNRTLDSWNNIWSDLFDAPATSLDAIATSIEHVIAAPAHEYHEVAISLFRPGEVKEKLKELYSASNLGFSLADTNKVYELKGPRELWFSGPCIAIRFRDYNDLVPQLREEQDEI